MCGCNTHNPTTASSGEAAQDIELTEAPAAADEGASCCSSEPEPAPASSSSCCGGASSR